MVAQGVGTPDIVHDNGLVSRIGGRTWPSDARVVVE